MDPLSAKYSPVGEGGAVGPAVGCKTVTLACDGGKNDVTFPGQDLFEEEVAIMIVLIGVSVTNLETKWVEMRLWVGFANPDPVGLKPREEPEPKGSV